MTKNSSSPRVGVEIEFSGLAVTDAAEIIAGYLKSEVNAISPHEFLVASDAGDYRIEVDFALLKDLSRETTESDVDQPLKKMAVDVLSSAAELITPLELVTPPLLESALADLDNMLTALARAGAKGTGDSLAYAFGVHFNPEANLTAGSVLNHIQAYCCLDSWLRYEDQTDLARRISGYAEAYPSDYEQLVLSADYQPDMGQLCADYLAHNATRNRALDLLPLFAHIDASMVQKAVDDALVGSRPTYHYRLPNSQVSAKGWSIMDPWQGWVALRTLAGTPEALADLCGKRIQFLDRPVLKRWDKDWITQCQNALDPLLG